MEEFVEIEIDEKSIEEHFYEAASNLDVAKTKSILEKIGQIFDKGKFGHLYFLI